MTKKEQINELLIKIDAKEEPQPSTPIAACRLQTISADRTGVRLDKWVFLVDHV
jgi:hypothetical protein